LAVAVAATFLIVRSASALVEHCDPPVMGIQECRGTDTFTLNDPDHGKPPCPGAGEIITYRWDERIPANATDVFAFLEFEPDPPCPGATIERLPDEDNASPLPGDPPVPSGKRIYRIRVKITNPGPGTGGETPQVTIHVNWKQPGGTTTTPTTTTPTTTTTTPTTTSTTPVKPPPPVVPVHSDDPVLVSKRAAAEAYKESLNDAKNGGLISALGKIIAPEAEKPAYTDPSVDVVKEVAGKAGALVETALKIVGYSTSVVFYADAWLEHKWANDPPASDITVIENPALKSPPRFKQRGLPRKVAGNLNVLLSTTARFSAYSSAFVKSFERVLGAVEAGNSEWESKQAAAAALNATKAATYLEKQIAARARLVKEMKKAGMRFTLGPRAVRGLARLVKERGLPKAATASLTKFGLSAAEVAQARADLKRRIVRGRPKKLKFPDYINSRRRVRADRANVAALRALAAHLTDVAAKTAG
jgi:hypothetical protein